jgi:glycerol-3-phosphate acyltransferase PlsY
MNYLSDSGLYLLVVIGAYAVGALPTGYLVARLFGISDIRAHGSGNIGATNVARIMGFKFFVPVMALDLGKAYLYLFFIAKYMNCSIGITGAAVFLLIGNGYSFFLQGSGGKGVATAVGICLFISPLIVIYALGVWGVSVVITRTIGISSTIAALSLPWLSLYCDQGKSYFFLMLFITLWIVWRHQNNLRHFFITR